MSVQAPFAWNNKSRKKWRTHSHFIHDISPVVHVLIQLPGMPWDRLLPSLVPLRGLRVLQGRLWQHRLEDHGSCLEPLVECC
jgi:hypothetical protein